jgi:cytidylate kinase
MHPKPPGTTSDISKVVERQMRNWELARAQHLESETEARRPEVLDFITISRTAGSGGREVATLLGERLNWPVFDYEILRAMAGDDQVRAQLYEKLDERDVSWLEGTLRALIRGEFRKEDYFHRLTETILALARRGHSIFLGRGADLILPRERGLRIRITASPERRAERFALRNKISGALARAEVERMDRERTEFRRHHFGPHANEATCHDLIINLDRIRAEDAVELILVAFRIRGIAG